MKRAKNLAVCFACTWKLTSQSLTAVVFALDSGFGFGLLPTWSGKAFTSIRICHTNFVYMTKFVSNVFNQYHIIERTNF